MAQARIMQPGPSWCEFYESGEPQGGLMKNEEKLIKICLLIVEMTEALVIASRLSAFGKEHFMKKIKELKKEMEGGTNGTSTSEESNRVLRSYSEGDQRKV